MNEKARRHIAVEGCIGAGKTTLARGLAGALQGSALIEESGKHPFIHDFYTAPDAFALETEITFVLLHYHQMVRELPKLSGIVVSDFALERDFVFARLNLRVPQEEALFRQIYSFAKARTSAIDTLIYLRAPIDFLAQRISKRGREYESRITRGYLVSLNAALERFFVEEYNGPKVIVDAPELDEAKNPQYVKSVLRRLPPYSRAES